MFPRSLLVPLQMESDFYQITFDLNQKDSMRSKLPLRIIAADCRSINNHFSEGHRMGNVFKVNARWFDRWMCLQIGLQEVSSAAGNFKWPKDADGTEIHSALDFGLYLVNRGWYTLESDVDSQIVKLNKIVENKDNDIVVVFDVLSYRLKSLGLACNRQVRLTLP